MIINPNTLTIGAAWDDSGRSLVDDLRALINTPAVFGPPSPVPLSEKAYRFWRGEFGLTTDNSDAETQAKLAEYKCDGWLAGYPIIFTRPMPAVGEGK